MPIRKKYLDIDVLTAAKQRIRHIYDIYDTVAVCFSGGKDSLTVLHLAKEIAEERGALPLNVIFRDEELIPDPVIDFVNEYRVKPWVKMRYYAVPLASQKYILGKIIDYVQWDPNRRHVRPMPEHAIRVAPGDKRVFDQYTMDDFSARGYPGKVVFLTGIRADESLIRFRSAVNKLNENYLTATESKKVMLGKPIYDWSEKDVFKFFHDNDVRYCPLYDHQHLAGAALRVSTPLHSEAAKRIGGLREYAPQFYQQVMDVFPEMLVQERYFGELDRDRMVKQYGQSFDGIKAYIMENTNDEVRLKQALRRLVTIRAMAKKDARRYPTDYVLKYFIGGSFKRMLLPVGKGA